MSTVKYAVRSAIAAAIAGAAAQGANALDISTYSSNSSTNVNVYISGSTAVDGTIQNAMIETAGPGGLCQAGTLDIYYIGSTGTYTNRLFYCTGSSSSGASGLPLALFKESQVGSFNGVGPLLNAAQGVNTGLQFIVPGSISDAACSTAATVAATGDFAQYVNHSGCPTTAVTAVGAIPTGGVADVEAAILRSPTGAAPSSALVTKYLTSAPTLDVVWGVALTKNAFYALQSAEGFTSPSDSPANAPSLSKSQVASIFTGELFNWEQLGLSPSDANLYLCRRDVGSGTEASFEELFLNERCSITSLAMLAESGKLVWASGSNGGVRNCLNDFFTGGTITSFYNQDGSYTAGGPTNPYTANEPGGQYAVGLLSTEVTAGNLSSAGDSFRLVAVDGVMPTLENVINGYYPYFSTGVSYYISGSTAQNKPPANALAVFTALKGKLGHPTWTADSDTNYAGRPWGNGGDLAPAPLYASSTPPTTPATASTALSNPTNAFTKASSGVVNNCDLAVLDSADLATPVTATESKLLGTGTVND